MDNLELVKSIKTVLCGILIAEYGARSLPNSKFELKQKVNLAIKKCLELQDFFLNNKNINQENKSIFKREFGSNKIVLLTEIMHILYTREESELEELLTTIENLNLVN